jgi:hypothetical protein
LAALNQEPEYLPGVAYPEFRLTFALRDDRMHGEHVVQDYDGIRIRPRFDVAKVSDCVFESMHAVDEGQIERPSVEYASACMGGEKLITSRFVKANSTRELALSHRREVWIDANGELG